MNYLYALGIGLLAGAATFMLVLWVVHLAEYFSDQRIQERHMKKVSRK